MFSVSGLWSCRGRALACTGAGRLPAQEQGAYLHRFWVDSQILLLLILYVKSKQTKHCKMQLGMIVSEREYTVHQWHLPCS